MGRPTHPMAYLPCIHGSLSHHMRFAFFAPRPHHGITVHAQREPLILHECAKVAWSLAVREMHGNATLHQSMIAEQHGGSDNEQRGLI